MKQIPNLKLIHVRFIPETEVDVLESLEDTKTSMVNTVVTMKTVKALLIMVHVQNGKSQQKACILPRRLCP